ncbi:hypothetical protein MMC28_004921 [Mycoblastus sanguinarius]|nr:hypothetical protein [Mycoblastus sanguinarius]
MAQNSSQMISNLMPVTHCCNQLAELLGPKVAFPNSSIFLATEESYWSLQEAELSPTCIVVPSTAEDVSTTISTIAGKEECPFAVKGGGHTPAAGSANIQSGITIDMTDLVLASVNEEKTIAFVGAGASWLDVYRYLDGLGVAVAGGRNAAVGVGGLTLGGGISYFAPREGWSCDNVVNFEIVLASGTIVNANATVRPDLWRALKGGSNNFGIVTRFDLQTFPQGDLWGGVLQQSINSSDEVFSAFANIASAPQYDPYASLVSSAAFNSTNQEWGITHLATYTKPVADPPVFEELLAIRPQLLNTLGFTNLSTLTNEAGLPVQFNWLFYTATYGVSAALLTKIFDITNETIYSTFLSIPGGVFLGLGFEPLPTAITKFGSIKGGNSLGTTPGDGNGIVLLLSAFWTSTSANEFVEQTARTVMERANEAARQMGMLHEFVYLDYANQAQDPIQSYGWENVEALKAVGRKYDPDGIFQRQVPGGFKLPM